MRMRALTSAEMRLARSVFRETIPYSRVVITDITGAGGAPFTLAAPLGDTWVYALNIGERGYRNAAERRFQRVFIHEMTHVWQGHHGSRPYSFMINSVLHQGLWLAVTGDRGRAYDYTPGQAWSTYNVEQQAEIVEHWYARGMRENDPLYPYVSQNIRGERRA